MGTPHSYYTYGSHLGAAGMRLSATDYLASHLRNILIVKIGISLFPFMKNYQESTKHPHLEEIPPKASIQLEDILHPHV